ncbi:MAG: archaeosortase/exosortase family protein, partial [Candidatus Omnitrophica bacterium]|nr:archaeosortase/exosortase family protein [Candidatus Omnitrophota bacterium]
MKKENLVAVLFIAILVAVVFLPIYGALVYRFTAYDTYYSHGFLVPLVSLYLVFRKRKTLKAIEPKPYLAGLFIFTSGLVLHVISLALKVRVTSYLSIPVVMLGIVLFLGGKKFARELLFPIGFLIFGLPLPKVLIIGIAFKLK